MGLIAEAKRIKEIHPKFLILYKSGEFYKAFGKDAYILSNLLNYQIRIVDKNVPTCGFPLKACYKVRVRIEENKISYMLMDPRNNYEVDVKEDFKNLNEYDAQFAKAFSMTKCKKRINNISNKLMGLIEKPNFKDVIGKVEEVVNEAGKV